MPAITRATFFGILVRALCIVILSGMVGLAVNAVSPKGISIVGSPSRDPSNPREISLERAYRLFSEKAAVFVDSRDKEEFRDGHIQGALSLPTEDFDHGSSLFLELVPVDTPIVTYCSGEGCGSSLELAEMLLEMGYRSVEVFYGGWRQWKEAGYPVGHGDL